MAGMNARIVFVDEHDRAYAVNLVQPLREVLQRPSVKPFGCVVVQNCVEVPQIGAAKFAPRRRFDAPRTSSESLA